MNRINFTKNNTVTTEEINLAGKYFGPNVRNTKGKTTITKPTSATSNLI